MLDGMIIPKAGKLTPEQLEEVERIAGEFDCSILEIVGRNRCVYAILGDESRALMFTRLRGLDFVSRVDLIESSYKSMDRQSAPSAMREGRGEKEVLPKSRLEWIGDPHDAEEGLESMPPQKSPP